MEWVRAKRRGVVVWIGMGVTMVLVALWVASPRVIETTRDPVTDEQWLFGVHHGGVAVLRVNEAPRGFSLNQGAHNWWSRADGRWWPEFHRAPGQWNGWGSWGGIIPLWMVATPVVVVGAIAARAGGVRWWRWKRAAGKVAVFAGLVAIVGPFAHDGVQTPPVSWSSGHLSVVMKHGWFGVVVMSPTGYPKAEALRAMGTLRYVREASRWSQTWQSNSDTFPSGLFMVPGVCAGRVRGDVSVFAAVVEPWFMVAVVGVPTLIGAWRSRTLGPKGVCGRCGYDVRGIAAGRCPECGSGTVGVSA